MGFISVIRAFPWNILNELRITKSFLWNVGNGDLVKWYVVKAYPTVGMCDNECVQDGRTCITQTLMAQNLKELAAHLKQERWAKLLHSVQYWSRPALECDTRKQERGGLDETCNYLIDQAFCIPELYSYIKYGDCPALDTLMCPGGTCPVWYSEYVNVQPSVSVGDLIIKGEKVGLLVGPFFHVAVGDGVGGGVGQTLDISSVFATCPATGTRAGGSPGTQSLNSQQIAWIVQNTDFPLDPNYCNWTQQYGSVSHTGGEYYAVDLSCDGFTVLGTGPPRGTAGGSCYCACGAPDVTTRVITTTANSVLLRHQRTAGPLQAGIPAFHLAHPGSSCGIQGIPGLQAQGASVRTPKGMAPPLLSLRHNVEFIDFRQGLVHLSYNKHSGRWEYSQHMAGGWTIRWDWTGEGTLSLHLGKGKKVSRLVICLEGAAPLEVSVNLKTGKLVSAHKVSHVLIEDGAGAFKDWPVIQLAIGF